MRSKLREEWDKASTLAVSPAVAPDECASDDPLELVCKTVAGSGVGPPGVAEDWEDDMWLVEGPAGAPGVAAYYEWVIDLASVKWES